MSWLSDIGESTGLGDFASILFNPGSLVTALDYSLLNMGKDLGDDAGDQTNDLNTQIYALQAAQTTLQSALVAQVQSMTTSASYQEGIDTASKRPNIDLQNTISGFNLTAMMQKYTQPPKLPTISG